jgi:hypothetical protein
MTMLVVGVVIRVSGPDVMPVLPSPVEVPTGLGASR